MNKITVDRLVDETNLDRLKKISAYSATTELFICANCKKQYKSSLRRKIICCKLCYGKKQTQYAIQKIIEKGLRCTFISDCKSNNWLVNPETNRKLELDIYSPELRLAIEVQGKQHDELCYFNKYDPIELENIQKKDELKVKECEANNVKLLVIALHLVNMEEMPEYCKKECVKLGYTWYD